MVDAAVVVVEDDFDKAFAEAAAAAQDVPADKKDEAPPADKKDETPPADKKDETSPADKKDAAVVTPPADETAEQKTARESKEASDATAKQALDDAKVVADAAEAVRVAAASAEKKKVETETAEQKTAREAFEATMAPYEPTEEEKAALEKFKKDFPGEYAGMEAKLKGVDRDINARVYSAVQSVLQQVYKDVTPIAQQTQDQAQREHVAALHAGHTDYDTVIPLVPDWIKKQPAYLQPAMQAVYDQGDAASVVALVADFKRLSGYVAPGAKTAEQLAAEEKTKAAAVAAKKLADEEAAGLVSVGTKRTVASPKGGTDAQDFDGAFEEASNALSKK